MCIATNRSLLTTKEAKKLGVMTIQIVSLRLNLMYVIHCRLHIHERLQTFTLVIYIDI